ncbi:conserved hypothetical protein [Nostocoides australiense Ben110]|uniref:Uncharacterized protein n=2 Tax=Nostocoides australiense TaxID=99480 RepID=W6K161_9MICO|nr:conserved hypothetical protein [Tetrasphaera australiensis Ben110]
MLMGGPTTRMQDAVRLLMLINEAAEPVLTEEIADDPRLETAIGVVRTQVRLQKLDFWVRNPDYLANELLNDYVNGDQDPALLHMAGEILDGEEPELRRYPMLRYLFGAYEDLEDALAVLRQADLVVRRRKGRPGHVVQTNYFLLQAGRDMVVRIRAEYEDLAWYSFRSALVVQLASGHGATQLKDRQYIQEEYLQTPNGVRIPSITERARKRLADIRAGLEGESA